MLSHRFMFPLVSHLSRSSSLFPSRSPSSAATHLCARHIVTCITERERSVDLCVLLLVNVYFEKGKIHIQTLANTHTTRHALTCVNAKNEKYFYYDTSMGRNDEMIEYILVVCVCASSHSVRLSRHVKNAATLFVGMQKGNFEQNTVSLRHI